MAGTVIIYHSEHHGNTKKVVEAIAAAHAVELVRAEDAAGMDFSGCDAVGFASGIYMSGVHPSLVSLTDNVTLRGKKAFVIYTSGSGGAKYAASLTSKLEEAGMTVLGVYHCKGFDTYGAFKLIGGLAKGRPTEEEINGAVRFYEQQVVPAQNR